MSDWFVNNIGTICVGIILAVIVSLIIFKLISNKKKGKSVCGCNCEHCAMAGKCHSKR